MLLRILAIILTFLIKYINSNRSIIFSHGFLIDDKNVQKSLAEIIRHYCLKPEYCVNGILTNYGNLEQEKIPTMNINFEKHPLPYISFCPNIGIFDLRSSNLGGVQIKKRCRETLILFLFNTIDLTYFQNQDYMFMDTAYILDEKANLYVFEPYLYENASRTDFLPKLLGKAGDAEKRFPKYKRK